MENDDNVKKAEEFKLKGNELFKQTKYSEALELFKEANTLNPKELTYNLNLAACYHKLKDYDKVIENCQIVIDETFNFEKKGKAYGRMGYAYQEKKEYQKAIECFEKALLEQKDMNIKDALNAVIILKKKKDEEEYLNPEIAEEANTRGAEKFKKHQFVEAMGEYTEAIKRNPNVPKYYSNRAICYVKLMSLGEALTDCEKALSLDPNFLRAHQRHCNVLFLMKRYHKALAAYEAAMKLYPDDSELKEGYYKCVARINEGGDDQERLKETMNDPEIQSIMIDPRIQQFLKELKENPQHAQEAILKDEFIREAFRKLVAAGIIKTK